MFLGALRAGRAAHAYLICGPEEGPLQELAMEGAALLLCGGEREAAPAASARTASSLGLGAIRTSLPCCPSRAKRVSAWTRCAPPAPRLRAGLCGEGEKWRSSPRRSA